ncbi:MAG: efflux transporter, family, subunit [Betaproteobacteria bacterium]|nr:efflux transporter, family, subunit [Betaproteobacteria bacterium]
MRLSIIAAVIAAILLAGCGKTEKNPETPAAKVDGETVVFQPGSPQLTSLVSEEAIERPAAAASLNGRLVWNEDRTVRIFTPLAGRVDRILVQPGDHVNQGQTLAVISSPDLGQAQADARRAQGEYSLAEQNLARVKELHQHGVAPAKDLNTADAEYARAESEMKRTQARMKLYGGGTQVDQSYALKSPLAGVVVEKNINPGQELRPDQMGPGAPAQFVITDPAYLWVLLDAAEKDLTQLKIGKTVKIRVPAYPDEVFGAKVTAVADFLDPATRTIKVRATLDNPKRLLKSEMFVTATVNDHSAKILQVPSRAVFFQGGSNFVFVDDGNGGYTRRKVETADVYDGNIAITTGLEPGRKVVTDGALLLQQMLQPRRVVK